MTSIFVELQATRIHPKWLVSTFPDLMNSIGWYICERVMHITLGWHNLHVNVFVGNYSNNFFLCKQQSFYVVKGEVSNDMTIILRYVHKLHWCWVQWEVSSPRECPHKQEVSQSGLSSPSYDSDHDIESVEHQVAVQQWSYTLHTLLLLWPLLLLYSENSLFYHHLWRYRL